MSRGFAGSQVRGWLIGSPDRTREPPNREPAALYFVV